MGGQEVLFSHALSNCVDTMFRGIGMFLKGKMVHVDVGEEEEEEKFCLEDTIYAFHENMVLTSRNFGGKK